MIYDELLPDDDMEAFLNAPIRFWHCPITEHRNRRDSKGWPVQEVEWVDGVATCLFPGCGRTSTDPVPRGECMCEEYDCEGECCGPGQCSCSPGTCPHCGRSGVHTCKGPRTTGSNRAEDGENRG